MATTVTLRYLSLHCWTKCDTNLFLVSQLVSHLVSHLP